MLRRIIKIGSFLKTPLLVTTSAKNVTAKSEIPSARLPINPFTVGNKAAVERPMAAMQITAIRRSAFL